MGFDLLTVLTTPLRPQYLLATLNSLNAEGAKGVRRCVHVDGIYPGAGVAAAIVNRGYDCKLRIGGSSGALHSMWDVLLRAEQDGCDRLLYFEDDIVCAPNAVTRILATEVRDNQALISFYDSNEFSSARLADEGIHDVPIMGMSGKGLFGACCLLIPRRTLKYILDKYPRPYHPEMPPHADQALSWALRDSPWPVRGVSIPSLVEHVGEISSMGHNAGKAAWFEGT